MALCSLLIWLWPARGALLLWSSSAFGFPLDLSLPCHEPNASLHYYDIRSPPATVAGRRPRLRASDAVAAMLASGHIFALPAVPSLTHRLLVSGARLLGLSGWESWLSGVCLASSRISCESIRVHSIFFASKQSLEKKTLKSPNACRASFQVLDQERGVAQAVFA